MYGESFILKKLSEKFAAMPGIGRKLAWRLAFYVLTLSQQEIESFAKTLIDAHKKIKRCELCQNLTEEFLCELCRNKNRKHSLICVVESSKDIMALEKSRSFDGVYHVLHGLISPLDGIGPNNLTIQQLLNRIKTESVQEVIMATSPTIEGDATAVYISKLLKPFKITISRLAYGIPVGGELQYADEITISKSLENRTII